MILDRAGTIALARKLTALRPKSRLRRAPKPIPPTAIELSYYRAIEPICDQARAAFAEVEQEILKDLSSQRKTNGMDAAIPNRKRWFPHQLPGSTEWKNRSVALDARRALHLAAVAQNTFNDAFDWDALKNLPKEFGKRIDVHQREQLDRQLRAATGLQYGSIEKPIRDHVAAWTTKNVELISTLPDRYFDRLRGDIEAGYAGGSTSETLAKTFAGHHQVSLNDARRIARDQTNKLNGQLNRARQTSLGIEGYTWRSVADNRTRDNHAHLDGTLQRWDSPPEGGGTDEGEPGHPGEGIQCRCYPDPDFSPLLSATDSRPRRHDAYNPNQPRVPAGEAGGGEFGTEGGAAKPKAIKPKGNVHTLNTPANLQSRAETLAELGNHQQAAILYMAAAEKSRELGEYNHASQMQARMKEQAAAHYGAPAPIAPAARAPTAPAQPQAVVPRPARVPAPTPPVAAKPVATEPTGIPGTGPANAATVAEPITARTIALSRSLNAAAEKANTGKTPEQRVEMREKATEQFKSAVAEVGGDPEQAVGMVNDWLGSANSDGGAKLRADAIHLMNGPLEAAHTSKERSALAKFTKGSTETTAVKSFVEASKAHDTGTLEAMAKLSQAAYDTDTVRLYRGVNGKQAEALFSAKGDQADVALYALSSWSDDRSVAAGFAAGESMGENPYSAGAVIAMDVPRSSIAMSYKAIPEMLAGGGQREVVLFSHGSLKIPRTSITFTGVSKEERELQALVHRERAAHSAG